MAEDTLTLKEVFVAYLKLRCNRESWIFICKFQQPKLGFATDVYPSVLPSAKSQKPPLAPSSQQVAYLTPPGTCPQPGLLCCLFH